MKFFEGFAKRNKGVEQKKAESLIASIGENPMHREDSPGWHELLRSAQKIDFYGNQKVLAKESIVSAGKWTYVLSPINSDPKFSERYLNCTGVAAVAIDAKTKQPISFLTHQDPHVCLFESREDFERDLRKLLKKFRMRAQAGSIDLAVFGGDYYNYSPRDEATLQEMYHQSIAQLSELIQQELGVEPHVAVGPIKQGYVGVSALLDTTKRRIYISRPYQEDTRRNVSFTASEIDERAKDWRSLDLDESS